MPQSAKKPASDRAAETLTLASGAEGKTQKSAFGFDTLPNVMDMGSRLLASAMDIQGGALKAFADSCGVGIRACGTLSSELTECGRNSLSQMMELSKEAAQCRTVNSVIELQQKAMQQGLETCLDATQKLSAQLHECCVESLQPLHEQSALVSEKIGNAMTKTTA